MPEEDCLRFSAGYGIGWADRMMLSWVAHDGIKFAPVIPANNCIGHKTQYAF